MLVPITKLQDVAFQTIVSYYPVILIPTIILVLLGQILEYLGYYISVDGPGVDSASKRNEYQEYFLGVKAAGA
jgi:hypothetical protein